MSASLFVPSLWIGLSIAAPVGPIGLLVIQRTLAHGRAVWLATGLAPRWPTRSTGRWVLSGSARWWVRCRQRGCRWRWAAAPSCCGWPGARGSPPPPRRLLAVAAAPRLLPSFAGTFVLTLSNPATILSFIAIFGALAGQGLPGSPWTMVAGVLAGSALWWLLQSAAVGSLRSRFDAARSGRWGASRQ